MADVSGQEIERDPALIPREFGSSGEPVDIEREEPGEEPIDEPFDPEKIDVVTRNPTVNLLLSRIRRKTIDLAPDFQRNSGIWKERQQSRLIESLLLRIPLPTFYAAENPDESWSIVDGIQRLTAITRFIDPGSADLRPLVLQNLEYLKRLDGLRFEGLPGRLQTRLEETEVVLHLIRQGTPEEVKFNIFARINTGGFPLTSQESRHALIPGQARLLLAELADSEEFQRATLHSVQSSRMADREMVLRFAAFLLSGVENYRQKDFDSFLRRAMKEVNMLGAEEVDDLRAKFQKSMDAAHEIFGVYAFRKRYAINESRNPINKTLFETISVALAGRSTRELDELVANSAAVNMAFIDLVKDDPEFERAISVGTGDIVKVNYRFRAIESLFARFDGSR
jgi:Protein of unknown function DUF262